MSKATQALTSGGEDELDLTPMIDIIFNLLIFFMVVTDLNQKDLAQLTLPVASMAEQDKDNDPDDRVILNVDQFGQIHWKGKTVNLQELGTILDNMRERYDLKMRAAGKSGKESPAPGVEASKLYVLLRADKDTPWQHVQWLMTIMAEQKLYKLQFATKQFKDAKISDAEAKILDAITQAEYKAQHKDNGG